MKLRPPMPVVAALFFALLLVPPYFPLLFQNKTLYQGDIFLYFEPTLRYLAESLKAGRLPLWNPLVCLGVPQIAIVSPGIFYPPNLLFLWWPFAKALTLTLMLHQWLAGIGTYLLAKELFRGAANAQHARQGKDSTPADLEHARDKAWSEKMELELAAIICGAIVALGGYMFGSTQCYTLPASFSWTPLALWLLLRILSGGGLLPVSLLALVVGLQILAGRPEHFLASFAIYGSFLVLSKLVMTPQEGLPWKVLILRQAQCAFALTLGFAISCVAVVPELELYTLSPRMAGLRFSEVAMWSAGWFDWLQTILTCPFGDLVVGNYHLSPHYPGRFPYISSLYIGAPAVTLCLLSLFERRWKGSWFWLALLLVFITLSAGEFGPILPLLHSAFPSLAVLRYPIKLAVFATFAASICAGAGVLALSGGYTNKGAVKMIATCWLISAALGGMLAVNFAGVNETLVPVLFRQVVRSGEYQSALSGAGVQLVAVSCLALAVCALALKSEMLRKDVLGGLLAALTVIPLLVNAPFYLWHCADADFFHQPSPVASYLHERQRQEGQFRCLTYLPESVLPPPAHWRPRNFLEHSIALSQYERAILSADVPMDFGLTSPYGFMPTDTRAFLLTYIGVTSRSRQYFGNSLGTPSDLPLYRFCQITNTRYLVVLKAKPDAAKHLFLKTPLLDSRYFLPALDDERLNVRVYRVQGVLPRAYFRSDWKLVPNTVQAMKALYWAERSDFDPQHQVMITSESDKPLAQSAPAPDCQADVQLISDTGESVKIAVHNTMPGFLVLSDTFYPGWRAYDGPLRLHIFQANAFQRGVWLAPGKHTVRFDYRPYSLLIGMIICGTALVTTLFLALFGCLRYCQDNRTSTPG